MKLILATLTALTASATIASAADSCHVAWSHYVGWEPAGYIQDTGIAKAVGDKYGVDLKFEFINDYVATMEQTAAGSFEAVTATTIDTLAFLSAAGVKTEVVVIGDYSNGNDAILVKDPTGSVKSVADLMGRDVNLYQLTISDYLFERAIALHDGDLKYTDFNVVNTTDADIGNVFATGSEGSVAVTWNPIVQELLTTVPGTRVVFDSSKIPGEILDAVVVREDASDACKQAITEAWYEGMKIMNDSGPKTEEMIAQMADFASGGSMGAEATAWFKAQLATTNMFYTPQESIAVANGNDLKQATAFVYDFVNERSMLTAPVGIAFPDGSVVGDKDNVLVTFNPAYAEKVVAGL